ncbi:MAG: winged helix-turn-helix domain-containing protein [Stellaceae bacterium]
MMPVIRVSDETWKRLKMFAKPLEDTADDVVKRALDALEARQAPSDSISKSLDRLVARGKSRAGEKLPQKEFRIPLIETVFELGGRADVRNVREVMERKMAVRLRAGDYQLVSSGDPRWWNAICWERADLVREGFFKDSSERGIWELSVRGAAFFDAIKYVASSDFSQFLDEQLLSFRKGQPIPSHQLRRALVERWDIERKFPT